VTHLLLAASVAHLLLAASVAYLNYRWWFFFMLLNLFCLDLSYDVDGAVIRA